MFGQYPLQVNGFKDLHECLEAAMIEGEIESLHSENSGKSGQEVSDMLRLLETSVTLSMMLTELKIELTHINYSGRLYIYSDETCLITLNKEFPVLDLSDHV